MCKREGELEIGREERKTGEEEKEREGGEEDRGGEREEVVRNTYSHRDT